MKIDFSKVMACTLAGGLALSYSGVVNASDMAYRNRPEPQGVSNHGPQMAGEPQWVYNPVYQVGPNHGYPICPEPQPNPNVPNSNKGDVRYTVKDGDTPTGIVKNIRYVDDAELGYALCFYNRITDTRNLQIGSVLKVPSVGELRRLSEQYVVIDKRYVYDKNNVPKNLPTNNNANNSNNNANVIITDTTYDSTVVETTPIIIDIPEESIPKEEFAYGTYKGITYNCDLTYKEEYIVKKDDTLNKITSRHYGEMGEYHSSLRKVVEAINHIKDPDKINIGQILTMPNRIVLIINNTPVAIFNLKEVSNNVRTLRP